MTQLPFRFSSHCEVQIKPEQVGEKFYRIWQTIVHFAITGGKCGYDRRDSTKSVKNVPLLSCDRDITSHKSLLSIYAEEVENEVDLILARSSLFSRPLNIQPLRETLSPVLRKAYNLVAGGIMGNVFIQINHA